MDIEKLKPYFGKMVRIIQSMYSFYILHGNYNYYNLNVNSILEQIVLDITRWTAWALHKSKEEILINMKVWENILIFVISKLRESGNDI